MRPKALPLRTAVLMALGLLVAAIGIAPYLIMFLTSLKPQEELFQTPPSLFPSVWEWSNYVELWSSAPIATYMRNSLVITVAATLLALVAAVPAGYYVARHQFRGRIAFMLFVLFTQMVAPTAVLIGLYRQFRIFGLIDSMAALVVAAAAFNLAFAVWILTAFFSSIPEEIEEAARIDGCSKFGAMRRIALPMAAPGIVTAAVFTFVAVWNEYVMALTLISSDDKRPLSVGITTFIGQYDVQYQYLFAASIVAIVPVVIMFASIEKRLVGGLTAGAVK